MARVNVGVNPKYLADQWLIAESVEITMITGGLKKNNFEIKSEVPKEYKLGTGHINFFKPKITYLKRRLLEVNKEMSRRGFRVGTKLDLNEYPERFLGDWYPNKKDTEILRERLEWKFNRKPNYWRYNREKAKNGFLNELLASDLYYV